MNLLRAIATNLHRRYGVSPTNALTQGLACPDHYTAEMRAVVMTAWAREDARLNHTRPCNPCRCANGGRPLD